MPIVKNGNRVLTVEEVAVSFYLNQGYDEVELSKDGKSYEIVRRATGGRNVSYGEYVSVVEENEQLQKENKALRAEVAKLKKADA